MGTFCFYFRLCPCHNKPISHIIVVYCSKVNYNNDSKSYGKERSHHGSN